MRRITLLVLAVLTMSVAGVASAHFKLNLNVRIFHVVHTDNGLELYMRTPMSYLVADKLGPVGDDGLPAPAPFTTNRLENGTLMHLVDMDTVVADPLGLGRIAATDLRLTHDGDILSPDVISVRVHTVGSEPDFATRDEAVAALGGDQSGASIDTETYVGDAVVDIHVTYDDGRALSGYALSVLGNPDLPGQEDTANLILDYRGETIRTYRSSGLMSEPVQVTGSTAAAAKTFVIEGVRHILEGLDHVLFVLCMILGASTLRSLLGRVTGFTVGHTVTLSMGFFGIAPKGAWFIPAVETAIALSIVFAAADAVLRAGRHGEAPDRLGIPMTTAIGLLHGFGFSFMLHNILKVDAPNVWQSLLSFNVGVELGQLLIVAATWPLVLFLRARPAPTWRIASGMTAAAAGMIACVWAVERTMALLA